MKTVCLMNYVISIKSDSVVNDLYFISLMSCVCAVCELCGWYSTLNKCVHYLKGRSHVPGIAA